MTQFLIKVLIKDKLKTEKDNFISAVKKANTEIKEVETELSKFQVTDDLLWNTREYKGYKLISITEDINLENMQARIDKYKFDWTILAANNGYKTVKTEKDEEKVINTLMRYDPKIVINFIIRKRIHDSKGIFIKEVEPTEIEFGRFQGAPTLESL